MVYSMKFMNVFYFFIKRNCAQLSAIDNQFLIYFIIKAHFLTQLFHRNRRQKQVIVVCRYKFAQQIVPVNKNYHQVCKLQFLVPQALQKTCQCTFTPTSIKYADQSGWKESIMQTLTQLINERRIQLWTTEVDNLPNH